MTDVTFDTLIWLHCYIF